MAAILSRLQSSPDAPVACCGRNYAKNASYQVIKDSFIGFSGDRLLHCVAFDFFQYVVMT